MTEHFPITPPPELVQQVKQWEEDWHHGKVKHIELELYIAVQTAQWSADKELEACIDWMSNRTSVCTSELRAARRPKPLSLKKQALMALEDGDTGPGASLTPTEVSIIRRALEALPDD